MEVVTIDISKLCQDPANARKHSVKNIDAIKGSLAKFGQQKPIVVTKSHVVVAGNGTLEAASQLGWPSLQCVYTDLERSELIAFGIADNRTGELAEWNRDVLSNLIRGLEDDALSTGFDNEEIEAMLKVLDADPPVPEGYGPPEEHEDEKEAEKVNYGDKNKELHEGDFQEFGVACPRCKFEFDPKS